MTAYGGADLVPISINEEVEDSDDDDMRETESDDDEMQELELEFNGTATSSNGTEFTETSSVLAAETAVTFVGVNASYMPVRALITDGEC